MRLSDHHWQLRNIFLAEAHDHNDFTKRQHTHKDLNKLTFIIRCTTEKLSIL